MPKSQGSVVFLTSLMHCSDGQHQWLFSLAKSALRQQRFVSHLRNPSQPAGHRGCIASAKSWIVPMTPRRAVSSRPSQPLLWQAPWPGPAVTLVRNRPPAPNFGRSLCNRIISTPENCWAHGEWFSRALGTGLVVGWCQWYSLIYFQAAALSFGEKLLKILSEAVFHQHPLTDCWGGEGKEKSLRCVTPRSHRLSDLSFSLLWLGHSMGWGCMISELGWGKGGRCSLLSLELCL